MAALKYWIWLSTLPGLSDGSALTLLEHFASPEDVYYSDAGDAMEAGLSQEQARCVEDKSLRQVEQVLSDCAGGDLFVVTMADASYPARLRNIYDPPLLLYGRGAMPLFDEEAAVAVVGTRRATPYGLRAAEELSYQMAKEGALVVSGMARGIDAAAHRGALKAGGFTAAVLGCGVDVVYPPENRRLYEDIAAAGVILSEYPPGTPPERWHFPRRNRIISGLSLATLVVEAPEKSGALVSAECALEQGRDVFAVPGPIDAPTSRGCHHLIRSGAGLVGEAWDVLGEYASRFPHKLRQRADVLPRREEIAQAVPGEAEPVADLPALEPERFRALEETQQKVLRTLETRRPMLADDIAETSELPVRQVLSALTVLEIEGLIRVQGARSFVRTVQLPEEE